MGQEGNLGVTFHVLGSVGECENEHSHSQVSSHFGSWSFDELSNLHRAIVKVKTHLGVPGQKHHLDVGLVERHKVYYKGEGGGFPQVRAVVSLVSSSLPMACPSTKSALVRH